MSLTASRPAQPKALKPPSQRRWISPLTLRILAINMLALILLVAGIMYLGRYQDRLIQTELDALRAEARLFAGALAEGGVVTDVEQRFRLRPAKAREIIRRLVDQTPVRGRLFDKAGNAVADSHQMGGSGGYLIEVEPLPPPRTRSAFLGDLSDRLQDAVNTWPGRTLLPVYIDALSVADQAKYALEGGITASLWQDADGRLRLTAAAPVQSFKEVLGAIVLSRDGDSIDAALRQVRLDIAKIFAMALGITVLLSLYLSGAIGRPIRRLAAAADRVRHGLGRTDAIPDFSRRHDEIGDLSSALRDMTESLHARMDATERFAADVAHELKNPLTSMRSAVETVGLVTDPAQRAKLMQIIQDDVARLDRLISDISNASRLDAELSRAQSEQVDLSALLATLVELQEVTGEGGPRVVLEAGPSLNVRAIESRMGQVFQNLIGNALSFSPPDGTVRIAIRRVDGFAQVTVEDDGPGIPEGKLEAIFERFYSERPKAEKFGTHSGLGLSISKQIVEALGGRLVASNRTDADGTVRGARFTALLPLA